MSPSAALQLEIVAESGKTYVPFVRRHLMRAHKIAWTSVRDLSLALVGDRRMSELHEQFLGVAGPTDVLTFPLELDGSGRVVGGEVVVCVPEARRRAGSGRAAVERELLLYALHGLLHLGGLDDRTASGFRTMHRMEDEILTQLGIGPVFSDGSSAKSDPKARRRRSGSGRTGSRRRSNSPARGGGK